MLRTLKATIAAATFAAAGLLACDTAEAQWGRYPGPTYLHAPYAGTSFSYGFNTGSPYSLYGPSYGRVLGYQTAYPTAYGYTPGSVGYGAYAGPALSPPRGRLKYDAYTPFGRQEIEYKFRRDGSVRVDIDD